MWARRCEEEEGERKEKTTGTGTERKREKSIEGSRERRILCKVREQVRNGRHAI